VNNSQYLTTPPKTQIKNGRYQQKVIVLVTEILAMRENADVRINSSLRLVLLATNFLNMLEFFLSIDVGKVH